MAAAVNEIDLLIAHGGAFMPYWGWHDDHRAADGTAAYRPALQQVRSEFFDLVDTLYFWLGTETDEMIGGSVLQLGIGVCDAPHEVMRKLFDRALGIDWRVCRWDSRRMLGLDTGSEEAVDLARRFSPFDALLIDAGHSFAEVARDHARYGPLVRPGGIIAFHDALRRPGFDEVEVWRYLETLPDVHMIGQEVGFGWIMQR